MKKLTIVAALFLSLTMSAQVSIGRDGDKLDFTQLEVVEVIINGTLIKGVDIFADGYRIKKVKFDKGFRQRKKTSWIYLLKKAGFTLTHTESTPNTFRGNSMRPTTTLIFEKNESK